MKRVKVKVEKLYHIFPFVLCPNCYDRNVALALVLTEIRQCASQWTTKPLLYDNMVATTAFQVWARMIGLNFLFAVFGSIFRRFRREEVVDEMDTQTCERTFQDVAGSLFFHRYIICSMADPCGYGITREYPSENLHKKLGAMAQLLGKIAHGRMFERQQSFMMQFNPFIEDAVPIALDMYARLAEGTDNAGRSEHIHVPNGVYAGSLYLYEQLLLQTENRHM